MQIFQLAHSSIQFEPPIFALGKLLASRGHDLSCIGYWLPGLPHTHELAPRYNLIRIHRGVYQSMPRLIRGSFRLARYWKGLLEIARAIQPDLVIAYNYDVLPIALRIAPSQDRIIYYCTEYSPKPELQQYLIGWGFLKHLEKRYVKKVGSLISVEPNRAELQAQDWGRKIDYIIMNAPLFDLEIEALAGSQLSHISDELRLVYAGSIGARNYLIQLMESVTDIPGVTLAIYGRVVSDYQEQFQTALQRGSEKSHGRIQYHGPVDYELLAHLLINYDLGVSFYDGKDINTRLASPAKLFEYMRSGLALLSTPQPIPCQIIKDTATGMIVNFNVPGHLSEILQYLLQQKELVKQMRRNALRAFRHQYTYERQAQALINDIEAMG